jgi:hypothetical protein
MRAVQSQLTAALPSRQRRWRSALSRSSPLAREIALILVLKFVLLWVIWWAFFSDPATRHMQLDLSQVQQQLLNPAFPVEPARAKR